MGQGDGVSCCVSDMGTVGAEARLADRNPSSAF